MTTKTTPPITTEVTTATTALLPRETQIKDELEENILRRGLWFDALPLSSH
jgi:hypothetical protein